jgi:hypothetical protein
VAGKHKPLRGRAGGDPGRDADGDRRGAGRGAAFAPAFPLAYATVGLVLSLRRPVNPIGWLFATSGLVWSLTIHLWPVG